MKLHQLKPLKKRKRKKVGTKAQKICRIKKKEEPKKNQSLKKKKRKEKKVNRNINE